MIGVQCYGIVIDERIGRSPLRLSALRFRQPDKAVPSTFVKAALHGKYYSINDLHLSLSLMSNCLKYYIIDCCGARRGRGNDNNDPQHTKTNALLV